jgi:hypothetical protein
VSNQKPDPIETVRAALTQVRRRCLERKERAISSSLAAECGREADTLAEADAVISVLLADVAHYRAALAKIAAYGGQSPFSTDGICPYGCDAPAIADAVIKMRESA